jgi:hypothetical protein
MTGGSVGEATPWWERQPWKGLRWGIAVLVFLALASLVIASYIPETGVASCRDELANNSTIVRICGPIGAADIVALGLVLALALLLIWPELSEVGVPGLFTLKKQVAENRQRTQDVEADVRSLTLAQPEADVDEAVTEATKTSFGQAQATIAEAPPTERVISDERRRAEADLGAQIQLIDQYLAVMTSRNPADAIRIAAKRGIIPSGDRNAQLRALRSWREDFDSPLRAFAAVRNTAVHFPERLTDEEVRDGADLGRLLLAALDRHVLDVSKETKSVAKRTNVVPIRSLEAEGQLIATEAVLTVGRDEPLPGVFGVKSWSVRGEADRIGPLPEDAALSMTMRDGRTLTGRGLLTNQRISSSKAGTRSTFEYLGNGPLEGLTEDDFR